MINDRRIDITHCASSRTINILRKASTSATVLTVPEPVWCLGDSAMLIRIMINGPTSKQEQVNRMKRQQHWMHVQSITIPRLTTANDITQTTTGVTMALSNKATTRRDDGAYINGRIHPMTLFNLAALIIHNNTGSLAIFK